MLGSGLLLSLTTFLLIGCCVLQRHRASVAATPFDGQLKEGETSWFETQIFLESIEVSCDFAMRVEYAELLSRVGAVARAANPIPTAHPRKKSSRGLLY